MSERAFVIVNPTAANGRVGKDWSEYRALIESELGPIDYAHTNASGHATELARQAISDGYTTIGSMGGDGTHHEVINGFFDDGEPSGAEVRLGILPAGTGGDFRRMLPVDGKDLARYARLMARDEAAHIDVGRVEYDDASVEPAYFVNIASFGMGGLVVKLVDGASKALGPLTYPMASLRGMFRYEPPLMTLTVDDEPLEPLRLFVGAACNGRYFGGGMMIGPDADLSDGLLDLVIMPWRSRFAHMASSFDVYTGKHVKRDGVRVLRGEVIRAETDDNCLFDIDGEVGGTAPATIRVVPRALRLCGLAE